VRRFFHMRGQDLSGGSGIGGSEAPARSGRSFGLVARRWGPWAALIAAMVCYALFYGIWSCLKYRAYLAPGFDIGIYDQGLWLLSRFKEPFVTVLGLNIFGDHSTWILLLFVPLYWIAPDPQTLLVVQTLALAVGAVPVFLLGRMILRNRWLALIPAVAYLVTPALGWLNLENFHPDSLEVPLLLFALYFVVRGRWRPYLVMVVLLLLVKEDVPMVLIPLGVYIAVRHNRRMGLLTVGMAAAWFCLMMFVVQPALSRTGAGNLDSWRIPFGGWTGLAATGIKSPWTVGAYMLTEDKLKYLFQLLTPVLFLPLLNWRTVIVVPILFFNLISNFWYQTQLQYHYTSLIIPVLCVMALLSLERFGSLRWRRILAGAILAATLLSAYLWGPLPFSPQAGADADTHHPQVLAAEEAVALIPPDAVVAAGDKFASHLTHREQVYVFPTPFSATYWGDDSQKGQRLPMADDVEYVIDIPSILPEETLTVLSQLGAEGFSPIYEKEGVILLKRDHPSGEQLE
jgi:uncharacterized membrane protein